MRSIVAGIVALLLVSLAGCGLMKDSRPPEEIVTERAQAWADALLGGDLEGAYAFTTPSYRESTSANQYHARIAGAGNWTSAMVESVECEPEACKVRVMIEYEIRSLKMKNVRPLDYTWLSIDDDWWLYVPAK